MCAGIGVPVTSHGKQRYIFFWQIERDRWFDGRRFRFVTAKRRLHYAALFSEFLFVSLKVFKHTDIGLKGVFRVRWKFPQSLQLRD